MSGYKRSRTGARDDERTEDRDALSASISGLQLVSTYQQRRLKSLLPVLKPRIFGNAVSYVSEVPPGYAER
jgi:hypothetical protein